jgi:multicomponent Na+:H+ antiporter subunit G
MILDVVSVAAAIVGVGFFTAGTVGLLRFPDLYCRLHAITKADTLGLGFIAFSVALQSQSPWAALKVLLIWVSAMAAGAIGCNLMAERTLSARTRSGRGRTN